MADGKSVLVLGATGGIGGEVARKMLADGWIVRALQRQPADPAKRDGIIWIRGDAQNAHEVLAAASGCSSVYPVNSPGYRRWPQLVLPLLDNTIPAATAAGATIVLPDTVYNFGPDTFPVLDENSPQKRVTRKGAIRVEMEKRLLAAIRRGARALIVRAGIGHEWSYLPDVAAVRAELLARRNAL